MSDREMLVEASNILQAKEGDLVEISVPESSLMKLSLLVYFIPVIALLIGAYAGNTWAGSFNLSPSLGAILAGGISMGITFLALMRVNHNIGNKDEYAPRMIRILDLKKVD